VDVAEAVPPVPYMPPAGWPGLVTVTGTVPGVVMADPGIVVVSWFAVMCVVVCFDPFQLMTASELKVLPLTVKVNPGSPAFAVFGTSCVIAGTAPGCCGAALGELYPPHPTHSSVSTNSEIIFITFSSRVSPTGDLAIGKTSKCQLRVIFL
jgi:hypothetical protein